MNCNNFLLNVLNISIKCIEPTMYKLCKENLEVCVILWEELTMIIYLHKSLIKYYLTKHI